MASSIRSTKKLSSKRINSTAIQFRQRQSFKNGGSLGPGEKHTIMPLKSIQALSERRSSSGSLVERLCLGLIRLDGPLDINW